MLVAAHSALDSRRFSACEAAWSGRIGFRFGAGHYADANVVSIGWLRSVEKCSEGNSSLYLYRVKL